MYCDSAPGTADPELKTVIRVTSPKRIKNEIVNRPLAFPDHSALYDFCDYFNKNNLRRRVPETQVSTQPCLNLFPKNEMLARIRRKLDAENLKPYLKKAVIAEPCHKRVTQTKSPPKPSETPLTKDPLQMASTLYSKSNQQNTTNTLQSNITEKLNFTHLKRFRNLTLSPLDYSGRQRELMNNAHLQQLASKMRGHSKTQLEKNSRDPSRNLAQLAVSPMRTYTVVRADRSSNPKR